MQLKGLLEDFIIYIMEPILLLDFDISVNVMKCNIKKDRKKEELNKEFKLMINSIFTSQ